MKQIDLRFYMMVGICSTRPRYCMSDVFIELYRIRVQGKKKSDLKFLAELGTEDTSSIVSVYVKQDIVSPPHTTKKCI